MEIYANGELLSVEFENEKNAFDIIKGVADFFAKEKVPQFITKIIIDGKEVSFADDSSLKEIMLGSIRKIEFEFKDIVGVSKLSIEQILLYIDLLKKYVLENQWNPFFSNISDSLNWIKDGMLQITDIFSSRKEIISLKEFIINELVSSKEELVPLSEGMFPLTVEKIQNIITECEKLKLIISKVYQQLDQYGFTGNICEDILSRSERILPLYNELIPILPNVSILLQKACDKDAMDIIQKLTVLIDGTISIFLAYKNFDSSIFENLEINGASFDALTENLNGLVSAIENKDSVTIGDLVEYEFLPNLEEMKELLEKLENKLLNKIS